MFSSSLRGNLNKNDPYHQYVDIAIQNADINNNSEPPIVNFEEVRGQPIIQNPSDYFFSIVRFHVETTVLPLFIPQVLAIPSNSDVNKLAYAITLSYDLSGVTYDATENIIYIPENKDVIPPATPNNLETSDYYFIYSYQHFINLVNNTFTTAYNNLNAQIIALGATLPSANKPFFEWDPYENRAILNADISGYNQALSSPINIYFNTTLFNLFSSFQCFRQGYSGQNEKNFLVRVYSVNNTNIYTLNSVNYLQMYQEFTTTPLWNPVSSLVFTSNFIPVNPSVQASPLIYGNDGISTQGIVSDNLLNVLTDFEVPLETGQEYRPGVWYAPSAEYRLFDLYGNTPFSQLQISVGWRDNFQVIRPFRLFPGCNATIKLMFRRKAFNVPVSEYLE
jgi:hypothetical protein